MKQNSSIVFHPTRSRLRIGYWRILLAAILAISCAVRSFAENESPSVIPSAFDTARGFKPAQANLSEIFLQLAASLEAYGTPEPYLRHVAAEHARVQTLCRQMTGKPASSFRPACLTDAYLDQLAKNWAHLAPKLGLESYAKEFGRQMREAITGRRGNRALVLEVLNRHQLRVFAEMAGEASKPANFEALRSELNTQLNLDKAAVEGTPSSPLPGDPIQCAQAIRDMTLKMFGRLDQGLKPDDAQRVKAVITGIIMDTGEVAQSELQAARYEWAVKEVHGTRRAVAYNAANETRLTQAERNLLQSFLKKTRFTKADFPALEEFYKGPYDRLSAQGQDEISRRIWNGTRPKQ